MIKGLCILTLVVFVFLLLVAALAAVAGKALKKVELFSMDEERL